MAEHKSLRLEQEQIDAIEDLAKRKGHDNASEAHRALLRAGMHEYGYRNGDYTETTLKRLSAEFARAFSWIGVAWLALTVVAPLGFRMGAVFAFFAAAACSGLFVALDRREPRVSRWISHLHRGDKA